MFRSIHDSVVRGLQDKPQFKLAPYFEELAEDERLLALGYCDAEGKLLDATKDMPKSVTCPEKGTVRGDNYYRTSYRGHPVSVAVFPLSAKDGGGELLVLHDLTFIQRRAHEAELYMALALVGVAVGLGLLGGVVVFVLMRGWTNAFRAAITNLGRGAGGSPRTRNCRSGATSNPCSPKSGSNADTRTASTSNGRPTRCISCWSRNCPARK